MRKIAFVLWFLFGVSISNNYLAQMPGDNDFTFHPGDVGFGFGDGPNGPVYTTAIQPDGKILIGGSFTKVNGYSRASIARLNYDGTLDTTFVDGGSGGFGYIYSILVQPDGKIVIGGGYILMRLNIDGTIDPTFNPGVGPNEFVYTISRQPDGKLIIGGDFTKYNNINSMRVARINTDGTLDNTFIVNTGADARVRTSAIQSDGKIVLGGDFTHYMGSVRNYIVRLMSNGGVDAGMVSNAGGYVNSVAIQSDGKIVIGGAFWGYNGTSSNHVARITTSGAIDPTFLVGTGASNTVGKVVIQSDGKIVIVGNFFTYNNVVSLRIARLNTNGTLDNTLAVGLGADAPLACAEIQPDGKIIITGSFKSYNGIAESQIARLYSNGNVDTLFIIGSGVNGTVYSSSIQSDGKIIIAGDFLRYDHTTLNHIARLNSDGSIDSTFLLGTGTNGLIYATKIQSDGKILIGGYFSNYNGKSVGSIARLNTDGTIDTTFISGSGSNSTIRTISIQADKKIIIGGDFTNYNGLARNRIIRLDTNAVLDTSFHIGVGANAPVYTSAIQSDGKIIIGGNFTSYNSAARNRIIRLNANGTLDVGFNIGTGANGLVTSSVIQSDGSIIIGGFFSTYAGNTRYSLGRLYSSGGLDFTFSSISFTPRPVYALALQSDGKIIVGLDSYGDNYGRNYIVRLNTNGSSDLPFSYGRSGANNIVKSISIQTDGKIVIGGDFTMVQNTGRNRLARLNVFCGTPTISNTTPVINQSICANKNTTLSVSGLGVINWYSSQTSTTSIAIGTTFTTPILAPGTYTYYADAYVCSSSPREAITVNVNSFSSPTITLNNGSICLGESFTLSPAGATTYTYSGGSQTVSPNVTTTYSVIGMDSNGCMSNTVSNTVTVKPLPTITVNSGTICSGNSFTIVPNGANTYSYSSVTNIVSPLADTTYTITGVDVNGCKNTTLSNVTVNPLPTVTVNSGSICVGNSFTIIPSGATSYSYSGGNDVVTPTSNTSYSITGTDINGCVSNEAVSSVTVNSLPIVAVNSGSVCAGNSFTIIPSGANTYSYSGGSDVVTPTSNTSYSITGTDFNGCVSNIAVSSITVSDLPLVMATTTNTLLCIGETATLTASGAASYTWSTSETTNNIVINPTATTTYTLNGIDVNGCSNTYTISQLVDLCTGIVESTVFEKLKLYPNPTNGLFIIELSKTSEIFITNVLGESILNEKFVLGKQVINIQNQPAGIYYVKVISNKNQQTVKLIKE